MNSKPDFGDDIAQVSEAADEKLMRLLRQATGEPDTKEDGNRVRKPAEGSPSRPLEEATKARPKRRPKRGSARPAKSPAAKSVSWSPPTALLNTRVPPEMADLLDDLVYRLRKERRGTGMTPTKQALACEAIEDLLKKYRMVG